MYVRPTSQPYCFAIYLILTMIVVGSPDAADAEAPSVDSVKQANHCILDDDELCGWVEIGTHDSTPLPNATACVGSARDTTVGILTSAVCAKVGVSIEQIVEPFAMVGPYVEHSLDAVEQFQTWWDAARSVEVEHETSSSELIQYDFLRFESPVDLPMELIAAHEPIDIHSFGPSVLVQEFQGFSSDPVSLKSAPARKGVLVGCSPMIFTIEEAYMAYDMIQRDVKLWCVFPTTTRPLCIRNRAADFDASPMWDEFDQAVQSEPKSASDSIASKFQCSSDCMLEEWVYRWEEWTCEGSPIGASLRPSALGDRLARLVAHRNHLAGLAVFALAKQWRQPKPEPQPSPAGAALLARAGASERGLPMVDDVNIDAVSRIAETQAGPQHR